MDGCCFVLPFGRDYIGIGFECGRHLHDWKWDVDGGLSFIHNQVNVFVLASGEDEVKCGIHLDSVTDQSSLITEMLHARSSQ